MTAPRAVLVVAPFWRQSGHVGVYRVDRFVRWLASAGIRVHVVCGGVADGVVETEWGSEITVRDHLGLYRSVAPASADAVVAPAPRKPNRIRREIARALLVPDPSIAWALRAARHDLVRRLDREIAWVISSSPPESSHVAAHLISRRSGAKHAVDLRDGWLDEPLRREVRSGPRRLLEARLERRVARQASRLFVTSGRWRELLTARIPDVAERVEVLTNGYPADVEQLVAARGGRPADRPVHLLYAGRLSGSRDAQSLDTLLQPLYGELREARRREGRVTLLGDLAPADRLEVDRWAPRLHTVGWELRTEPAVPRSELFARLRRADGLLLLAASGAAIPSKIFEYLPTRLPILAVTPRQGAVWRLLSGVRQAFIAEPGQIADTTNAYLDACETGDYDWDVPEEFGEPTLKARFLATIGVTT